MKRSKWLPGILLISATCLTFCGKSGMMPSHSKFTEAEALQNLELRLAKTDEVKIQLNSIRDALKPIEAILHDFGKAIDLKVDRKQGDSISRLLDRMQDVLRNSLKGIVETHDDGSWVLDQPSPLNALPKESRCDNSRVRLSGVKIPGGEEVTLSVSGCASRELQTLAIIRILANGEREITLTASTFETEFHENISVDSCKLKIDKNVVGFHCEPMKIVSESNVIGIERLEFKSDSKGVSASIHATLSEVPEGLLATAEIVLEPNQQIRVRVCTRGESCAN